MVRLPKEDIDFASQKGIECVVIGWGLQSEGVPLGKIPKSGETMPNVLHKAEVKLIKPFYCKLAVNLENHYTKGTYEEFGAYVESDLCSHADEETAGPTMV